MTDHDERPEKDLPAAFEADDPAASDADDRVGAGRVVSGEAPAGADEVVEEASEESFPGSDAPAFTGSRPTPPK